MTWLDLLLPIAVSVSTILASFFSAQALRYARRESARLADVASANLIVTLREPWSRGHFKAFLDHARNGGSFEGREGEIEGFLNRMEIIGIFLEQNTLREVHVKEIFGSHFKLIKDNKAIESYYNRQREEKKDYIFTNIAKALVKMEGWGV